MAQVKQILCKGKIQRIDGILSAEVDGDLVLMNVESGLYFGLDLIGANIWARIEKPISLDALVDGLLEEYTGDKIQIQKDVENLLNEMVSQKIMKII